MRVMFALVVALLPVTAFAQSIEGPDIPIPVQRCVQTRAGAQCTPIRDGAGFADADGYRRVSGAGAPSDQAMAVPPSAAPAAWAVDSAAGTRGPR